MDFDTAGLRRVRRRFSWGLTAWSLVSIVAGLGLWRWGGEFRVAAGMQCAIWGAIDLVFAVAGVRQAARADRRLSPPADVEEGQSLLRALSVSHKMNWMWLAMGAGLAVWAASTANAGLWGHAVGVGVQGGFLFVYDRLLDRSVRATLGGL